MEKSILEKINKKDYRGLEKLMNTPEALALSYDEKNKHFITSHKLVDFTKCPHGYYLRWIAKVPPRYDDYSDALTVGSAFDDLMTSGKDFFDEKYEVVKARVNDIDGEIEKCGKMLNEAKNLMNKNGTRSAVGIKAEAKLIERLRQLESLKTKTQLTNSMYEKVLMMAEESEEQKLFIKEVKKKILITEIGGFVLKAELDSFDEKELIIVDKKTTANITTFNPMNYAFQMAFYQLLAEEVFGVKCRARLEVTDKFDHFSRSAVWEFSKETLESYRGQILTALKNLKDSTDSGMFVATTDQEVLWNSPYYGHEGYGRVKKIIQL